ncbi:Ribosomal RNA large subunit methyltransferase Cfr [Symbiodinium microadriaticum]|uniref:Ribosomal RNA large subunit methyltransferase Cfr n=1 Tax=Symbiodinium microadriaticum TaxID=2951 RepID=A0A1Q9E6B7_SYMMI|nr:Ribosomal RNA large subunit methyltransferase Cfr [Symbiodinium microadriaticum]
MSARRLNVSTVGVLPGIVKLTEVFNVLDQRIRSTGRRIWICYLLLQGINDSADHARALAQLIRDRPTETRCAPQSREPASASGFGSAPLGKSGEGRSDASLCAFVSKESSSSSESYSNLAAKQKRVSSSYRNSFGHGIDAACGQLFAGYEVRTNRLRFPKLLRCWEASDVLVAGPGELTDLLHWKVFLTKIVHKIELRLQAPRRPWRSRSRPLPWPQLPPTLRTEAMPLPKSKPKVRVLFLDVDGVLHPASCGIQLQMALGSEDSSLTQFTTGEYGLFQPRAMKCLARILFCSGARVVLSSAWRALPGGRQAVDLVLRRWGLLPVYSVTPGEGADRRVEHIWTWLSEHRDKVEGYAVVDDMDLSLDSTSLHSQPSLIAAHFVRTPGTVGLSSGHVSRLLAKLQKEPTLPKAEDSTGIAALLPSLPKPRTGAPRANTAHTLPEEGHQKERSWRARARTCRRGDALAAHSWATAGLLLAMKGVRLLRSLLLAPVVLVSSAKQHLRQGALASQNLKGGAASSDLAASALEDQYGLLEDTLLRSDEEVELNILRHMRQTAERMDASGTADTFALDLLGVSAALAGLAVRDPSRNNTKDIFVNNMKGLVDELQDHIHSSIQPHQEYLNGLYGSFQTCRDELYASLAEAGKQNSSVSLGRAAHVRCRSEQAQAKTSLAVCEAAKQDLAKADECTAWPVMQVTSIPDAGSVCLKTAVGETYEAYVRRMKEHWDDELSKYESMKAQKLSGLELFMCRIINATFQAIAMLQ